MTNNLGNKEALAEVDNISEKFKDALASLELPWFDIKSKLGLNNWRDSMSIWGTISKFIFKTNRQFLRRKVMHFWYQNTDRIKDQVHFIHESPKMIDNKLILIVSIDLSKLVANPISQIYELDESSTYQECQPSSYLSFDKLPHPQHITSVDLSEISSQASWYNNDLDTDASTNELSHQHHTSISNVDMKENYKFDSTLTLNINKQNIFSSILKSGVVLSRKLGIAKNYYKHF